MSDSATRNLAGVLLVVGLALGVAVDWWVAVVLTGLAVAIGIGVEVRGRPSRPRSPRR